MAQSKSSSGASAQQQILEEEFDENYEPAEEEIEEYAKFLGMDPETDRHLFWIARESLKAPLPPNWKPCQTDEGNVYYFNFSTGESIWDHPCDEHYRKLYEREKAKGAGSGGRRKIRGNAGACVDRTKAHEFDVNALLQKSDESVKKDGKGAEKEK
ncbi:hypothetical protein HK104_004588, partial [Borealophlyctis nickersoniae]